MPKAAKLTKEVTKTASKKVEPAEKVAKKEVVKKASAFSVPVYSLLGREVGDLSLPKEIFGAEVNDKLLSQVLRVYITNQKVLPGSTKTRGEVEGSTAKIFRQKGTGRARHGGIRAPIFVGGGIVFGPKPRNVKLDLPKRMKKVALYSALSARAKDKNVLGISGLEKASGKTKEFDQLFKKVNSKIKSALIVTAEKEDNVVRAVRNLHGVDVLSANLINAYEILRHEMLIITKEAVNKLEETLKK